MKARPHLRRSSTWFHGSTSSAWVAHAGSEQMSQANAPYLPVAPTLPWLWLFTNLGDWPGDSTQGLVEPGTRGLEIDGFVQVWMSRKGAWGIKNAPLKPARTVLMTGVGATDQTLAPGWAIEDNWDAFDAKGYQAATLYAGMSLNKDYFAKGVPFKGVTTSAGLFTWHFEYGHVWPRRALFVHVVAAQAVGSGSVVGLLPGFSTAAVPPAGAEVYGTSGGISYYRDPSTTDSIAGMFARIASDGADVRWLYVSAGPPADWSANGGPDTAGQAAILDGGSGVLQTHDVAWPGTSDDFQLAAKSYVSTWLAANL